MHRFRNIDIYIWFFHNIYISVGKKGFILFVEREDMEDRESEILRKEYELSKDFRKNVGEVIRKKRTQKSIKREALAKELGVDASHLSR